jgi:hypothetical protein
MVSILERLLSMGIFTDDLPVGTKVKKNEKRTTKYLKRGVAHHPRTHCTA